MRNSTNSLSPLAKTFYLGPDVALIAKSLIGKFLYVKLPNEVFCGGEIVETEAYAMNNDKACHSFGGKRTNRTEVMFNEGGCAYVYWCYGIHRLFNVITNQKDHADAVLIRGIRPIIGKDAMIDRRKLKKPSYNLTAGPGCLSQALGVQSEMNGLSLNRAPVWISEIDANTGLKGVSYQNSAIRESTRVGVESCGTDAWKPWRFSVKESKWVSPGKGIADKNLVD